MDHDNNFAGVMRQIFALLLAHVPEQVAGMDAFQLVHGDAAMLRERLEAIYAAQTKPMKNIITRGVSTNQTAQEVATAIAAAFEDTPALHIAQLAVAVRGLIEQGKSAHDIQAMSDEAIIELARKKQT